MLLFLETNGVKDETDDRRDRIDVRRMNEDGTAFILMAMAVLLLFDFWLLVPLKIRWALREIQC
jgi:hypothetical protein